VNIRKKGEEQPAAVAVFGVELNFTLLSFPRTFHKEEKKTKTRGGGGDTRVKEG